MRPVQKRRRVSKFCPTVPAGCWCTHLLEIQVERLETRHGRDVFALVALDALDGDDAVGDLVGVLGLGLCGLRRLLLCVLGGALLGVDGERGCGCF